MRTLIIRLFQADDATAESARLRGVVGPPSGPEVTFTDGAGLIAAIQHLVREDRTVTRGQRSRGATLRPPEGASGE